MAKLLCLLVVCVVAGSFLDVTADDNVLKALKMGPVGYDDVEAISAKNDLNEKAVFLRILPLMDKLGTKGYLTKFKAELQKPGAEIDWTKVGFNSYKHVLGDAAILVNTGTVGVEDLKDLYDTGIQVLEKRFNDLLKQLRLVSMSMSRAEPMWEVTKTWKNISPRNNLMRVINRINYSAQMTNKYLGDRSGQLEAWANLITALAVPFLNINSPWG